MKLTIFILVAKWVMDEWFVDGWMGGLLRVHFGLLISKLGIAVSCSQHNSPMYSLGIAVAKSDLLVSTLDIAIAFSPRNYRPISIFLEHFRRKSYEAKQIVASMALLHSLLLSR